MPEPASGTRTEPRAGISLLRIAGMEIRLDYSWFLIFLLILVSLSAGYFPGRHPGQPTAAYWIAGLAATLLFFLSILAHELSHAFVARWSGIRVPAITLFLFGGVSHMEGEARRPSIELRVAIVGPLTSFALAALFWAAGRALPADLPPLVGSVVTYLAWINAAVGVFNLLPGFPLDGGRVLRALAWWKTGSLRRATRIAADVGKGLAIGLMILGALQIFSGVLLGGLWLVFIGMFLRTLAESSYQNLVLVQMLEELRVSDVAIRDVSTVPPELTIQELIDDYLLRYGYRGYPVVEGGRPLGLISVTDLRDLPPDERRATKVRERMRPLDDSFRVTPDLPLIEALHRLRRAPDGRLLVMRGDELLGMLTKGGLARFIEIRNVLEDESGTPAQPSVGS
jgi:Zn-dependent protease/CBS domain-containing protein